MTRVRARGEDVRRFILEHLDKHPSDISKITAQHFAITRQAVNKHLQRLVSEKAIIEKGKTRNRSYKLGALEEWDGIYYIKPGIAEDVVWREEIIPVLGRMPDNVLNIWHYGFTEMFNNAIDHSGGREIYVQVKKTAVTTEMLLMDDGIGIFKKIQTELGLLDERHAIIELSKGKLTTDPNNHTGEGIFFTSRVFDQFDILSGGVYYLHKYAEQNEWIAERERFQSGTSVWMKLNNHTARTVRKVQDQFTSGDDFAFSKTIVPVRLARYGNENLISRSQAKRLLARVEVFKVVILDFSEVPSIGQAFADEIFRVFPKRHPEVELLAHHASSEVKRMIERAKSGRTKDAAETA